MWTHARILRGVSVCMMVLTLAMVCTKPPSHDPLHKTWFRWCILWSVVSAFTFIYSMWMSSPLDQMTELCCKALYHRGFDGCCWPYYSVRSYLSDITYKQRCVCHGRIGPPGVLDSILDLARDEGRGPCGGGVVNTSFDHACWLVDRLYQRDASIANGTLLGRAARFAPVFARALLRRVKSKSQADIVNGMRCMFLDDAKPDASLAADFAAAATFETLIAEPKPLGLAAAAVMEQWSYPTFEQRRAVLNSMMTAVWFYGEKSHAALPALVHTLPEAPVTTARIDAINSDVAAAKYSAAAVRAMLFDAEVLPLPTEIANICWTHLCVKV